MPITNAQIVSFFENEVDLGIPTATRILLENEGIASIDNLAEFYKDDVEGITSTFRRMNPVVPFSAKCRKRLIEACELIRFYQTINRDISPGCIHWVAIKNFTQQWKSLKERKEETPDAPKITKELGILRWSEAFQDFLNRMIGLRMAPLAYVTRELVAEGGPRPAVVNNCPHSSEYLSVEGDLVAYATHAHPLYKDDNVKVYFYLEEVM